jgi:DNA primase
MSAGLIPPDVITQIRERVDITEVVSSYVGLTRSGQNLKGLCPFHAEKTPSFTVSPAKQIFHCFGCGAGGSVFTFMMKIERIDFPEAVRELGRRAGISVRTGAESDSAAAQARARLEQLHEAAAAWFHRNLLDPHLGADAMAYLEGRGIHPAMIEVFRLGIAPAGWDGLIKALGKDFSPIELALGGLIVTKEQSLTGHGSSYDRFRNRVMIPITDLRKRVIAFGGRMLGQGEPKYLNSPETPLFSKGRTLFALEKAREAASRLNQLIVVEGYFDAIALYQAGVANVVATLGTALTGEHLNTIRRFVAKLILLFDPDPAGVRAALRTLALFAGSGLEVAVVSLPDEHDPDTFIREHGTESFLRLQEQAPSLLDFAVEHSLRSAASGSIEERIRSVDEILRILQTTGHRIEKEECLRRVAERLGLSQQRLIERYPELLPKPPRAPLRSPSIEGRESRLKRNPEEWDLVCLLLQGHLTAEQVQRIRSDLFTVAPCRRIVEIARRHVDSDGQVLTRPLVDEALEDADCGSAVTALSMSDRVFDDIAGHIEGCLAKLERKRREHMLGELIVKLRAAEREGRIEEARVLNAQVNDLRPPLTGGA